MDGNQHSPQTFHSLAAAGGKANSLDPLPAPAPWKQACWVLWGQRLRHGTVGLPAGALHLPRVGSHTSRSTGCPPPRSTQVLLEKVKAPFPDLGG